MGEVIKFNVNKGKSTIQEVQGVQVFKKGDEFEFNYQTSLDPKEQDIEILKNFRNNFILELKKVNFILSELNK